MKTIFTKWKILKWEDSLHFSANTTERIWECPRNIVSLPFKLTTAYSESGCLGLLCHDWGHEKSLSENLSGQIGCQLPCWWCFLKGQVVQPWQDIRWKPSCLVINFQSCSTGRKFYLRCLGKPKSSESDAESRFLVPWCGLYGRRKFPERKYLWSEQRPLSR